MFPGLKKGIKLLLEDLKAIKKVDAIKAETKNKSLFNEVKKYSTMKENSIINRQSTNSRNFYKKI